MKFIGIQGSPRKEWNTATLLEKALDGVRDAGGEAERIDLYDLQYRGCVSCFSCKRKDGVHGVCAQQDDLTAVLEKIRNCDGLIVASPMYYTDISAATAAFWERLLYSNSIYSNEIPTVFPKSIPVGLIYDMNMQKAAMEQFGIQKNQMMRENSIAMTFRTRPRTLWVCDTYQFDDYEKYESSMFPEPAKAAHKARQFPLDLEAAYQMGQALAAKAQKK